MLTPLRIRVAGFTLVEMAVVLVILAVTMTIALPMYSVWLKNAQLRNVAESVLNGMLRARVEALSRNASVAFVLGGGPLWSISVVSTGEVLESRPSGDSSSSVQMVVFPSPADPMVDPPTTTITFGNLGSVVPNTPASSSITQIDFDTSELSAPDSRDLRITVGVGGGTRLCDPNVSDPADPRHC